MPFEECAQLQQAAVRTFIENKYELPPMFYLGLVWWIQKYLTESAYDLQCVIQINYRFIEI